MRRWRIAALALVATLAGIGAASADPLKAVASFSILGDLVHQVGGDRVEVAVLVGPNGDAHTFSPAPSDARKLAGAQLVVINGLDFEGWIERLVKASGTRAPLVVASRGVTPIREEDGHGHGGHDAHSIDPHAWQSIGNAKRYVAAIREGLIGVDPEGRSAYEANAAAYLAKLDALEGEVRAAIAGIPEERRRVITTHDAFGYFAKTYGMRFIAPQGVSSDTEATAKDVARIIAQVKREKIPAVFLENISDPRLMLQIARETGAKAGGRIFSDALSERDGPAPTYIDMMRHNIREFTAVLRG
ncbi:metal ABC transporter substrate-binding protein [Methylobacterium nodulans]|uniref:Periplasmic solute binding protein n=1 Tax=Methylobacterium nodulans (strain LMG 21967 / CNCM I-2342 / ORS 2060) TaxID=460265 RepID=B8IGX4_METNO|nr:metal ABC transporter substrate-binding protein [Methylobacterium nodulans]ACL57849.1 periplasmic solute binding protein [Methylobacterium nodulans ORS 2060]